MTANIVILSPGGNITALVINSIAKAYHARVAQTIMLKHPEVEQVGFVEDSHIPGIPAHLEMMGGEFCGNAARALAYTVWNAPQTLDRPRPEVAPFRLTLSGSPRPLQFDMDGSNVSLEMAFTSNEYSIRHDEKTAIVELPGIVLVFTPEHRGTMSVARDYISAFVHRYRLSSARAVGIIEYAPHSAGWSIDPTVWVRGTDTVIHETACSSAVIGMALLTIGSQSTIFVSQPSKSIFEASIKKDGDGCRVTVKSPVALLGNHSLEC